MASHSTEGCTRDSLNDDETDYGSDFTPEEEEILLSLACAKPQVEIEGNPIATGIEHHGEQTLRIPRTLGGESRSPLFQAVKAADEAAEQILSTVKDGSYSDSSIRIKDMPSTEDSSLNPSTTSLSSDTRSPLDRFRTPPKKALSVTDLVSPAWCEIQYWYTLTRHGRKRRTPAMKQGSIVHKRLEDQVHTTVEVNITTKEDAWGLRIWNVIHGLRTLRDTGLTRELEVWGVVDDQVVNGVIDELSYICPDKVMEDSLTNSSRPSELEAASDQPTISRFFEAAGESSLAAATNNKQRSQSSRVYVCDVKTRSSRSLPSEGAFKPTKMQLMLYHSLLSSLAMNSVDFNILTSRFNLDPLRPFSDSFIAQVGSLNDDFSYEVESTPGGSQELEQWSQDSMAALLAHNSLSALWSLMISVFQTVLPHGRESLGNILRAEYRRSDTGEILGSKTFPMDEAVLGSYVAHEMQWWRGERKPQGVVVEEAFKCRSCEFADDCEWRLGKDEEAKQKAKKPLMR